MVRCSGNWRVWRLWHRLGEADAQGVGHSLHLGAPQNVGVAAAIAWAAFSHAAQCFLVDCALFGKKLG